MKHLKWTALALACAMGSGAAMAGQAPAPTAGEAGALAAAGETGEFARRLQAQERLLVAERAHYPAMFQAAYARYPDIPAGTLEALAYSQSRWHQLRPDRNGEPRHGMPQAWGVMGLYAGDGFADQVGEAAALLGTTPEQVKHNPSTNILAAAVLLDRELRGTARDDEALAQALQRYAGFGGTQGASAIDDYARASFAFDVLLGLDRGVDDNGIRVPERPVQWERAFPADMMATLGAPMVRLDVEHDTVETDVFEVDPRTEQLVARAGERGGGQTDLVAKNDTASLATVDFPGARWVSSPNYSSRSGTAVREVAIHTMQGSYAGSISWFQNSASQVSAHYLIRSSDGQVTQMVRESQKAWHVGSHNAHSIGIEHEGYISNPDWYTNAMYNTSAAITRQSCSRYAGIVCTRAMKTYTASKLSDSSYDILGHQNLTDNSHTDPGQYWNWSKYYGLINPGSGGTTKILDSFESSVGHFVTSPTYSGSTTGISTASTAKRNCSMRHNGSCSLQVRLVDNTSSSAAWAVRLLSGSGNPGSNTALSRNGRIGFWVYVAGSGMKVAVGIDDSDGTERSTSKAIAANKWTYVEWKLSDAAQWNAWAGNSNGTINASTVKLDAIWFLHANTSYTVNAYIDNVQLKQ